MATEIYFSPDVNFIHADLGYVYTPSVTAERGVVFRYTILY